MIPRFGRPAPMLSMVTNKVIDFVYDTHGWRIKQWNHDLLSPAHVQTYADAVYAKGAALENYFGFVDGTVRPIARPDENQRVVYNGHKRVHALKFQSVALPNGIIANMYGPVGGYYILINFNQYLQSCLKLKTFHCYEFQNARSMMRACCVNLDYFSSYSGMRILQQDNLCAYMGTRRTP